MMQIIRIIILSGQLPDRNCNFHPHFLDLSQFFLSIYGVKFCMRKIGQILGSIYVQGFETINSKGYIIKFDLNVSKLRCGFSLHFLPPTLNFRQLLGRDALFA